MPWKPSRLPTGYICPYRLDRLNALASQEQEPANSGTDSTAIQVSRLGECALGITRE